MIDTIMQISAPYPEVILLESTNHCNYRCTMCPQGHGLVHNKGFMDQKLLKKVIDEVIKSNRSPKIGFHIGGEPLLHPEIAEMVAYVTSKGLFTFFHTNGALLTPELSRKLVKAGLNEITFSFEGEDKVRYEEIRVNGQWQQVYDNILEFLKLGSQTTVIIEVLKFRGRDQLEISSEFKTYFALYPQVKFKSYYASDWHGTFDHPELKEDAIKEAEPGLCGGFLKILSVAWDGKVKACGIDYNTEVCLGDLTKERVYEVWTGKKRSEFLQLIFQKQYHHIPLCAHCGAPYTQKTKERKVESLGGE